MSTFEERALRTQELKIKQLEEAAAKKAKKKTIQQKSANAGLFFDNPSNSWAFRLSIIDNLGDRCDTVRTGYKSQAEARTGRESLRYEWKHKEPPADSNVHDYSKTFAEVFAHYKAHRAQEKRPSTERKHDSLWMNHIKPAFGDRKLSEVSRAELYNYMMDLYLNGDGFGGRTTGYAFDYVTGFLKFFWLIYGYAYDNNWVDSARYTNDFLNAATKLTTPKKLDEDDNSTIQIYTQDEIDRIRDIMKTGNLYITFLICYHCGLRISECMGLMWSDFNAKAHTLSVSRQMLYDPTDKVFYLGPPKTKKSKRTVYVPNTLNDFLLNYKQEQEKHKKSRGYKNKELVVDRNGKDKNDDIYGGDFIQRKENGELITINSVKYWTMKVKKEGDVDFHFHALRHTNASILAANNIPATTLMEHLGHANVNIAQQYYIASTDLAKQRLHEALDTLR
ncbi:MAG: tyrosine-type recombinase/integrase [Bacteroides sp.]